MDLTTGTSSSSDPLVLGGLLVIIAFIMLLCPASRRHNGSRLMIWLVMFILQFPTALAYRGRRPQNLPRGQMSDASQIPRGALAPEVNKTFFKLILMLIAFVIFTICFEGLILLFALVVPSLPLAYALKSFTSNYFAEQTVSTNKSAVRSTWDAVDWWTIFLPLFVQLYSCINKPRHIQLYANMFVVSASLGVMQTMVADSPPFGSLWLSLAANVSIIVGHVVILFLHLIDTIQTRVKSLGKKTAFDREPRNAAEPNRVYRR
jgi:hypothetical protein